MDVSAIVIEALRLALWLSAPALGACVLVAALVGFFQATTQVNDVSLGFVPKLCAVLGALWLSRAYLGDQLLLFSQHVLQQMAQLSAGAGP